MDAQVDDESPHILAISGRTRAYSETVDATVFLSQSPSGTEGVARIWAGNRKVKSVTAQNVVGEVLSASYSMEEQTILVRYANDADGTAVRVNWE
jgi:hypothetical protein